MIDLNKIVNDTLKDMEKEGFVEKVVKETLEKTIQSIVEDVFRSYGDFGKKLKKHIESNLNVNLDRLGLDGYNGLVLSAVKEKLDAAVTVQGVEKIKEGMDKILSDVKPEYTLSEIIEQAKRNSYRDLEYYYEDDKLYMIIEKGTCNYTYIYIHTEEDEPDSKYDYEYIISLDSNNKPYSIRFNGEEINPKNIMGGLFKLDALLFKIYSTGATIKLDQGYDIEDYDLYYNREY